MNQPYSNHITNNIITKGWMNISAITKGWILPSFQFVIRRKGMRGGLSGWKEELKQGDELIRDLQKAELKGEEIEYIQVFINWDKKVFKWGKNVYVDLIKKDIQAQISIATSISYNIQVELIKNDELNQHIIIDKEDGKTKISGEYLDKIYEVKKPDKKKKKPKTNISVELIDKDKKDKNK